LRISIRGHDGKWPVSTIRFYEIGWYGLRQGHAAWWPRARRPIFSELANLSARKIAAVLNERKIPTPAGGEWHAATVIRVQKRLAVPSP
jgi:hypothetical protein